MVGGGLTALMLFFLPIGRGSLTGYVVANAGRSTVFEILLLMMILGAIAIIITKSVRK